MADAYLSVTMNLDYLVIASLLYACILRCNHEPQILVIARSEALL
jgi:hypothetical protein